MSPSAHEVAGAMANGTQALSGQADPGMRTRVLEAAVLEATAGATLPATHDGIPNNPTFPMVSSMRHEGSGLDSYGATQHAPSAATGQIDARDLTGVSVSQSMLHMASPGIPQLALAVPQEGQLHAAATPDDFFMHLENADGVEERSAGSPGTTQPPALRWMTRLTEFLRTTATRGVNGVDRVFGELGFATPTIPTGRTQPTSTSITRLRQQVALGGVGTQRALEVSPPEELPHDLGVPPSWSRTQTSIRPLFQREDVARLQQVQDRSSFLLGSPAQGQQGQNQNSEGASTDSSAARAEMHRRLEDYHVRQREEMVRLQQEIFNLRAEKAALEEGKRLGFVGEPVRNQGEVAALPGAPGQLQGNDPPARLQALAALPGAPGQSQGNDPQALLQPPAALPGALVFHKVTTHKHSFSHPPHYLEPLVFHKVMTHRHGFRHLLHYPEPLVSYKVTTHRHCFRHLLHYLEPLVFHKIMTHRHSFSHLPRYSEPLVFHMVTTHRYNSGH